MSAIEWTDETWNPTVGCSRVSAGCDHCYAIRVAAREMQPAHVGLTFRAPADYPPDWTGEVRLLPDRLDTPLRWRKPRRVFVDSMSDLFHPDVPAEFIESVFGVMGTAERHTFQVLTKRPQRMREHLKAHGHGLGPIPNVWLGTSVENQRYADLRIPHLLATPAAVRFLSIEPLLGPVDLDPFLWASPERVEGKGIVESRRAPGIDWVIVGGESGPGARPMRPDWVRSIRDQCVDAGVPFFFKQWGEWAPFPHPEFGGGRVWPVTATENPVVCHVGKKAAGRTLDGRTWDEYPSAPALTTN